MKLKSFIIAAGLVCAGSAAAAPTQWTIASGGNGHWYEFISTGVTWDAAFQAANGNTFSGMAGYLATITSAAENSFVANIANNQRAWLGGSDAGNPNVWTWRNGPEFGQAFTYANWRSGEPNNWSGGEDYLEINFAGLGLWNDTGAPATPNHKLGYVVEYSAMPVPEPEAYALILAGLGLMGGVARRRSRRQG